MDGFTKWYIDALNRDPIGTVLSVVVCAIVFVCGGLVIYSGLMQKFFDGPREALEIKKKNAESDRLRQEYLRDKELKRQEAERKALAREQDNARRAAAEAEEESRRIAAYEAECAKREQELQAQRYWHTYLASPEEPGLEARRRQARRKLAASQKH